MNITDWIGFIGVFQILLAYTLSILGIVDTSKLIYILLNLFGASLACLASIRMAYIPFILLEGVWSLVSLISLFSYIKKKKRSITVHG